MSIAEITNNIIESIKAIEFRSIDYLGKRKSKEELYALLNQIELELTFETLELYQVTNGIINADGVELGKLNFFPGFYLMSIEEGIISYQVFLKDDRWNKDWFPIFANGGGDFFAIDCNPESASYNMIIGFMLDFDVEIEYLSLKHLLRTIDACFEKGAYYVDNKGFLQSNLEIEDSISKELNVGLTRWGWPDSVN